MFQVIFLFVEHLCSLFCVQMRSPDSTKSSFSLLYYCIRTFDDTLNLALKSLSYMKLKRSDENQKYCTILSICTYFLHRAIKVRSSQKMLFFFHSFMARAFTLSLCMLINDQL